jgi:hypothetical protein
MIYTYGYADIYMALQGSLEQVEEHKTLLRKQCLLSRDRIFMRMGGMLTRAQPVSAVPNPGPSHLANAGGAFVRRGQRPLRDCYLQNVWVSTI